MRTYRELFREVIEKHLLAPFSNKLTRGLLVIGGSLLALPTVNYLAIDIIAKYIFSSELGLAYPSEGSFITGTIILAMAVIHNMYATHHINAKPHIEIKTGENYIKGQFSANEAKAILASTIDSPYGITDYQRLKEKYEPIISLAVLKIDEGNLDEAREIIHSVLGEMPLGVIGSIYLNYGYYFSSIGSNVDSEYYQVALRVYKDIEYKEGVAATYRNLGESARRNHDFELSENYQKEAILIAEELQDDIALAFAITNLGLVYAQQCRHEEAEHEFHRAIAIYEKLHAVTKVQGVKSHIDLMRTCPNYKY